MRWVDYRELWSYATIRSTYHPRRGVNKTNWEPDNVCRVLIEQRGNREEEEEQLELIKSSSIHPAESNEWGIGLPS